MTDRQAAGLIVAIVAGWLLFLFFTGRLSNVFSFAGIEGRREESIGGVTVAPSTAPINPALGTIFPNAPSGSSGDRDATLSSVNAARRSRGLPPLLSIPGIP